MSGKYDELTFDELRQALYYNPASGEFTWRRRGRRQGKRAGAVANGSRRIGLYGRYYEEQRLAWFYMTGAWPESKINHADLNRSNNRWGNLRPATNSQISSNSRIYSNNTSGFKGVSLDSRKGRWRATIRKDGCLHHLGYFHMREEAHAAYVAAAVKLFGKFARSE